MKTIVSNDMICHTIPTFILALKTVDKDLAKWAEQKAEKEGCNVAELKAMIREAMNIVEGKPVR